MHEENNMLRFKIEVLLDLYASTRLDYLRLKEQVCVCVCVCVCV